MSHLKADAILLWIPKFVLLELGVFLLARLSSGTWSDTLIGLSVKTFQ